MIRTILAAVLTAAIATYGAWAHSKSEKTEPADGSTVASVETITIGFDKPMRVTAIKLLRDGADAGIERETGMEPVKRFMARPAGDLAPGAYTVEWRGLSDDGHPMNGAFSFTVGR